MSYWLVQAISTASDPELFPFLIGNQQGLPDIFTFIQEDNNHYLKVIDPNNQMTIKTVEEEVDDRLTFLNGNISFHLGVPGSLTRTDKVIYVDAIGQRQETSTLNMSTRLGLRLPFPQSATARQPNFIETQVIASKDPTVKRALQYYMDQPNWFSLFDVYEIIQIDYNHGQGKTNPRNFLPLPNAWVQDTTGRSREKDFTESANNANLTGFTARHSYARSDKIVQINPHLVDVTRQNQKTEKIYPMTLNEAKTFIDKLLTEWLKSK